MCGIFGLVVRRTAGVDAGFVRKALTTLALLSESRGKDSSGLVFRRTAEREFRVLKAPFPLNELLRREEVTRELDTTLASISGEWSTGNECTFAAIGHSRLATNGSQLDDANNQPVVKDGIIGVHNGIIVNDADLWLQHPEIHRAHEIDTEVMLALVRAKLGEVGGIARAISRTMEDVVGVVAAALFLIDHEILALATNNGSLYALSDDRGFFAFASEEYFLRKLAITMRLDTEKTFWIRKVAPGDGILLDLVDFRLESFSFVTDRQNDFPTPPACDAFGIVIEALTDDRPRRELIHDPAAIAAQFGAHDEAALLEFNVDRTDAMRRCTKCILPETFPFIGFDEDGICDYCRNYVVRSRPRPIEELMDLVKPYRRSDGGYDCIIPFSGGRDSTHTLHIAKNVLKLNPVTFTYDWGMVTDLARRNIARVCGKLGVENIIVSADIAWKRRNIRSNVLAWLRNPQLGMIPLFMAGDKFFYYYTDQVKRQTGIRLNIWGVNPLENTDFKVGFLGVPPDPAKKHIYSLSAKRKAQLLVSVGKQVVRNPRYLNGSVLDTAGSFVSRSLAPHRDYYHLYDYYRWDEHEIEKLVLDEYGWETAIDTKSTWRIGDGTAPFYNYIYYTVAGFSEHESFRSNQIREGMLTRAEALSLVREENRPRYPSIRWYTDIVGLDYRATIERINRIPKLYQ